MKINILIALIIIISSFCYGLDNPISPDYIGDFEKRIKPFEDNIQKAQTTYDYTEAYNKFEIELDKELNKAYKLLMNKLNEKNKIKLKYSQIQWLKYRDSEIEWIINNFTQEEFGTSYVITVGEFRTKLIKNRVEELYWYLKQY